MPGPDDQRLAILLTVEEMRLRRRLREILDNLKARLGTEELARAIIEGRAQDLVGAEALRSAEQMAAAVRLSYLAAADSAAAAMSAAVGITTYDVTNTRAVERMRRAQLDMVVEFTSEQREIVRNALTRGIIAGQNPRVTALDIRGDIGLTTYQQRIVDNYRHALETGSRNALDRELRDRRFDRTVEAALRAGRRLSREQIDKMVDRYRERWLHHRAETLARDQSLRAVHEGDEDLFRQLVESGEVAPDALARTWITAKDSRVRDSHAAMEGQTRSFGIPFVSGNGNLLRHPGDAAAPASESVQCRCTLATRLLQVGSSVRYNVPA